LKPGIQCQAITKLQRFAINPGGQDFTRLLAISPPFKKDYFILDRCMRELEIEFGYGRANGPRCQGRCRVTRVDLILDWGRKVNGDERIF
jgi:hypothetical protein